MRFSIAVDPGRPWHDVVALVRHVDVAGWDGVYVCDHFIPNRRDGRPADGPMLEGWTTLAALAGVTSRIRLGTLVLGNTYRHPAVVANMAATMDHVTSGRFVLGVGAGWQVNEHAAYGIDLPPPSRRLDQFEEACRAIRSLLREPRTTLNGVFYQFDDAACEPKPVQSPLPLLVGGAGERRTMRIAAQHADEWHAWGTPEQFHHKCRVLDDHCVEIGRDPATIQRSSGALLMVSMDPEQRASLRVLEPLAIIGTPSAVAAHVDAYRAAGADEFIVRDTAILPLDRTLEMLSLFLAEVVPRLRDTPGGLG